LKDDNELDQGFIEEDGAEQENINSKMVNLDEKEDELLKSIDKEDVKMIESFPEGENNQICNTDSSRREKLSNLILKEKLALEKPHVVLKKFEISELSENLKKLYKHSEVIKSKKKKKKVKSNEI
jgi:hypothetical protein